MSGPTPLYPVNLKIAGRLCLVVGGGPVAVRKVGALLIGGGRVRVVSPEAVAPLRRLAQSGRIEWRQRLYRTGDLDGAFIVIAATNRPEVQRQVARDAAAGRVLLNSTDDPAACDFQVPSQLKRGDLLITISTGGASPAFSRRIRESLEAEFGWEYGVTVDLLGRLRALVMGGGGDAADHAPVFRDILELDLAGRIRDADWDGLVGMLKTALPPHLDPEPVVRSLVEVANREKKEYPL
ncbi:bifunctional precorrin-2 dehydrogenase/sirohydrochlorin ferrochelatase [Desulfoprunum benzoelyticum]|uniref:precorrin-2 dehydrogenase n=1 Tax=Desulfoprunum benzoelyticum TaxID=1506996 RepID=A0A840UTP7_9BACT|nr:bifunctional precorrin-2 dehydrogenase/sirohydrochlorin ferrochelatase [Desulfoprunum benzoelyticum]MBB5349172.1 precorrin-2 dehydrogenase/sirohydrochlorin ferrochelatase [Desulfoprunum benzoelyticum]MBM9530591.1 bifunctional precorrin-2 dehydrogenase/sirohydrochlorin ferrochelatase [Desulfoprunum benzoelyticum]